MMEFDRQGLPRRSSASTLDEQAGTRAGLVLFSSPAAAAAACRQHCQIAWSCGPPNIVSARQRTHKSPLWAKAVLLLLSVLLCHK